MGRVSALAEVNQRDGGVPRATCRRCGGRTVHDWGPRKWLMGATIADG